MDDHQIGIDGLKMLLSDHQKFIVEVEANSGEDMLVKLKNRHIDVLLTDITIPQGLNGFELALRVRKEFPQIRILALSMSEEGALVAKMLDIAQVDGYISKAAGQQELLRAIEEVSIGRQYFAPEITRQYNNYKKIRTENEMMHLTQREIEIISCILKHFSNRQIAAALF